ncbi:Retrotransposon-derived protein peg10 [Entomophthora muscae]|uniref:Retrotransposon-derived protein peg10 n=1 Tax=Entomophthora muscae TaxID=34485 RepID=A0ACC2SDK6_9FUNG|nr:Retrotransposon-derived protein peg10 [Entomophthora muscae]
MLKLAPWLNLTNNDPFGAIISLVWLVSLHGPTFFVSVVGAQSQKSSGGRSTGPAVQGGLGSGFDSCSQAWVSREKELSILTDRPQQIAPGFLVHHNLPDKLEPLIREVVLWNQKYLSLKTHSPSNLSPTSRLFIPDKALLSSTSPPGTEPKSGGGFCLTAKEVLRRRNNNLCFYCGSKNHLLPACPLSKCPPFGNKTSPLILLSSIDTFKSLTVLVTINGPLGKIKVLALLDTGADANFIEEKLAKLIGLSTSSSLDVKVGNSTIVSTTPIPQLFTIDLKGSSFRITCNSSPNLYFPFILGFLWLRESLLNFDHPNNNISFMCNDIVKSLPLVSGTLFPIPPN